MRRSGKCTDGSTGNVRVGAESPAGRHVQHTSGSEERMFAPALTLPLRLEWNSDFLLPFAPAFRSEAAVKWRRRESESGFACQQLLTKSKSSSSSSLTHSRKQRPTQMNS